MSFSKKHSRLWTFLSLWSLLALAAPQLLMACPMNGKMTSSPNPAHCCSKKMQNGADAAMKGCCKKVPLPPSDTSGDDEKIALPKISVQTLSIQYFAAPSTPFTATSLAVFEPQFVTTAFSPLPLHRLTSQHTSSSCSGRAPPL